MCLLLLLLLLLLGEQHMYTHCVLGLCLHHA
jgi:hypothetical protein